MHDTPRLRRRRSTGVREDEDPLAVPSTSTPSSVSCPDCERIFDSSKAMKVHVFRCHTASSTPSSVSCPHCERTFDTSTAMRVHIFRAHKGLNESVVKDNDGIGSSAPLASSCVLCPDCERSFESSKAMKVHVYRTHTTPNSEPTPISKRESLRNAALGKRKANRRTIDVAQAAIDSIAVTSHDSIEDRITRSRSLSAQNALVSVVKGKSTEAVNIPMLHDQKRSEIGPIDLHQSPMQGIPKAIQSGSSQSQGIPELTLSKSKNPLLNWLTKPKTRSAAISSNTSVITPTATHKKSHANATSSTPHSSTKAVTTPEESLSKFQAMMNSRRSGISKSTLPNQLPISNTPSTSSAIARASSSKVDSNTPVSSIERTPALNSNVTTTQTDQRASVSPLAMSKLSLNKSAKSESPLSSAKTTPTPLTETMSPSTLSTLSLNGSTRSRLGGTTTTPRSNESSPSIKSTPITGAEKAALDAQKAIRQKLIAISGQIIKQCFESTKALAGFRNIFSEEEIESIKESIIDYRRSKFTSENNAWVWKTEEKTAAIIECDVKAQMSVCIKEQLKKRPRIWNEQLRRFAPHNCEAISQAAYLLDFAFSSDMKSFVYFIDTKEMLKCGRGWNDQNNDEARDARLIVEQEWTQGIGRKGRSNFIKIKTPAHPEYFVAMSILEGGLEKEDMDLWTAMIEKSGSTTLILDEYIKPKDMDQWVLHRMRRKEMKEHPNLQIWESVLAETEVSKMVDRRMKEVLRALVD